jgi:RHS repeat-associated protein
VTYLVNSSQSLAASYRYDPYGNTISSSGTLAGANVYRFSSKELHVNSGLYYYGYRWYHPNLQRWPNRDPLGEPGFETLLLRHSFVLNTPAEAVESANLYGYVLNSPINLIDPFGNASSPMEWYKRCSALANISLEKGCECFCQIAGDTDGSCMRTCKNCYSKKLDAQALCRCLLNEALEGTYAKEQVDAICEPLKCPPKKEPKIPDISIPHPPSKKPPATPPPHRRR